MGGDRELQKAGYSMKDIELVIGILGTDGQKAAQALTLMNQLRSLSLSLFLSRSLCILSIYMHTYIYRHIYMKAQALTLMMQLRSISLFIFCYL